MVEKTRIVIVSILLFAPAAAAAPHHPLSQIYPMDVDLNLSGQDINEIGDLRLGGGSATVDGSLNVQGSINMAGNEIVDYITDSSTNAPSTPEGGQMWFDSGQNVLKYYNGTRWVVMASANAVSSDLQSVLGAGNSAGSYDINMSGQDVQAIGENRLTIHGFDGSNTNITEFSMPAANAVLRISSYTPSTNVIAEFGRSGITFNEQLTMNQPLNMNDNDLTIGPNAYLRRAQGIEFDSQSGNRYRGRIQASGTESQTLQIGFRDTNDGSVTDLMRFSQSGAVDIVNANLTLNDHGMKGTSYISFESGTNMEQVFGTADSSDSFALGVNTTGSESSSLRLYIGDNGGQDNFEIWSAECNFGCNDFAAAQKQLAINPGGTGGGSVDMLHMDMDMHGNRITTSSCPAGMSNVNNDFCIDSSDRAGVYWSTAVANCRAEGYRLASYQDYIAACEAGVLSNINGEWLNNMFNDDDAFLTNSDCTSSPPFNFEGTTSSGGMTANNPYRCVYDP